jgi:hypothetical protein
VGDLVAGQYGFNPTYNPTVTLDEDSNYLRRDFVPDNPSGTLPETGFLARLRRSNENFTAEPGIASNGPTLPFLFGRGSMMARSSDGATDLTTSSGITVRATAIAAAGSVTFPAQGTATSSTVQMGHVLVAGPADPVNFIVGIAPFGLTATYWSSLVNPGKASPGTDTPTVNPATGIITSTLAPPAGGSTNPNATEAGVTGSTQTIVEAIGQLYAAAGSDAPLAQAPNLYLYVPIYDTIGATPRTIVAFGYVKWSYTTGALSLTVPWNTSTNLPRDHVASENATASLTVQWPASLLSTTGAPTLIQQIFTENQGLSGVLLAPVIASHYFGPSTVP